MVIVILIFVQKQFMINVYEIFKIIFIVELKSTLYQGFEGSFVLHSRIL